ncbi:MAG: efflux RND transporter periplasmic adaptor subunit [bacterium]
MKKALIALVIVVVAVAVVAVVAKSRKPKIPDVRIVAVEKGDITKAVVATGEIRPLAIAEVKSKIGGVVRKFFVDEGQKVVRGQRLAEIVPAATPEELVAAREAVKTAKLQLDQAKRDLKRLQELAAKNLVSERDVDDAETQLSIYAARYDAAAAELQVLEQGGGAERQPAADQGAAATEALADMIITSPVSGIVLSRNVDEGSSVIAMSSAYGGTSILTLADVSTMHFEGDVDESDVGKIHPGMPAKIYVDAFPDTSFQGVLTKIAPVGIKAEGVVNFSVEAQVTGETQVLRTGMSADVQLVLDERTGVLTLPEGAFIYEADSTFVEKVDAAAEGGKRRIQVQTDLSDGIKTQVTGGLGEGDKVVMQ